MKSQPPGVLPVIAIFGPTGSGKSAVAEALAGLVPAEIVSADAMQAYEGLPILDEPACIPDPPRRRLAAHAHGLGRRIRAAGPAPAIDEVLAAGRTPVVAGGTGLYLRAALAELALPPAAGGRRPRALRARVRAARPRAHTCRARSPRSGCGRGRSRERPAAGRASARAARCGELAEARRGQALRRGCAASDRRVRARCPAGRRSPRGSRSAPTRCSSAASRTRCAVPRPEASRTLHATSSASARSGRCLGRKRSRPSCDVPCATRPTSGNGSGASRALLASGPTDQLRRSPLRFSKWHALGNDYLLVERADAGGPLDDGLVRRLCAAHRESGRTACSRSRLSAVQPRRS